MASESFLQYPYNPLKVLLQYAYTIIYDDFPVAQHIKMKGQPKWLRNPSYNILIILFKYYDNVLQLLSKRTETAHSSLRNNILVRLFANAIRKHVGDISVPR